MKCRRVEKLIPLYVEGDLASGMADRVTSHLDWCGRCNWLAGEYKESQSWLHSCEPPDFDDATLNGLKADVLREIAETSARPSLLASLVQQWSRRQVFALSAAMLIVFGVVVFYIYQARVKAKNPVVQRATKTPDRESPPSNETRGTTDPGPATGAGLSKPHAKSRSNINARARTPKISEQIVTATLMSQVNRLEQSGIAPVALTNALPVSGDDSPDMLRIEIQTSDPNIRIIWFAPREVDSPKPNQ